MARGCICGTSPSAQARVCNSVRNRRYNAMKQLIQTDVYVECLAVLGKASRFWVRIYDWKGFILAYFVLMFLSPSTQMP